jgi:uncharacterized protein
VISSRVRYGLSLLLLLFITSVWAELVVPKLSQRVTDLTGTLSAAQISSLETKLAAFETKKGSQIAVLIVPTTQPEDIAEYGIQVADLWQIGRKGVDDGVIFIIAKDDHKLRLEVGRGLEGVIPDAIAKRIIAETVTPYFKAGDFFGGIDAGVSQLMSLIDGEELPEPKVQANGQSDEGGYLFILVAGLFAGSILTTIFGRLTGGIIAGVGSAAVVALLFGLGLAALVIGFIVFFMIGAGGGGGGWSNGGGFGRGGGGSWGGGGSSSWGGGGGGFGGGGASGSW